MKFIDDYNAKYEIWAKTARVSPIPKVSGVPRFGSKKFNSYKDFNAWKKILLEQIAAQGGVKWTK